MSFIAKNPLSLPQNNKAPSTPTGTRGLFAKEDGFYEVDSNGVVSKLCNTNNIKEDNTFVVNVINSEDNIVTADKTYQEILEAYNNGKIVIALLTDYSITTDGIIGKTSEFWVLNNQIAFSASFLNQNYNLNCTSDNEWSFSQIKLVLDNEIGDIETALDNIITIQNTLIGGVVA